MRTLALSALMLFATLALWAATDLNGKWKGTIADPQSDLVFDLKVDGSNVTGTMTGQEGKAQTITKGKLDGDKLTLTIASEWQGNPITLMVEGTVAADDTIKMTIHTEGNEWSSDFVAKKV